MLKSKRFRRTVLALALSSTLVVSAILVAYAQSATSKNLSTNITLVNLASTQNDGLLKLIREDGTEWRNPVSFVLENLGDQKIYRQYDAADEAALNGSGSGSGFVSASGQIGAVVQIQARGQVATSGAYSGSSGGAESSNVPLVIKNLTSGSGLVNSQIIIQNASSSNTSVEVQLIDPDGNVSFTKSDIPQLAGNASYTYDLAGESGVPDGWFGSAVVKSTTTGNQVAVVSNLFSGAHAVQTFNAFSETGEEWLVPLFTSRLANSLSSPLAVQNLSGQEIPAGGIQVECTADAASGGSNFTMENATPVKNTASFFFNPVTNSPAMPDAWFGSCRVKTTGFQTVAFVQLRVVSGDQAAAYEAIKADGTKKKVVVPLYAKQLGNGFASAVTIQNLSATAAANVTLKYVGSAGATGNCSATFDLTIPANGSLIQNHRTNAVTQIDAGCFGSLVVESNDQPIDAFVQLTDLSGAAGDTFQAHNAFTTD